MTFCHHSSFIQITCVTPGSWYSRLCPHGFFFLRWSAWSLPCRRLSCLSFSAAGVPRGETAIISCNTTSAKAAAPGSLCQHIRLMRGRRRAVTPLPLADDAADDTSSDRWRPTCSDLTQMKSFRELWGRECAMLLPMCIPFCLLEKIIRN